MRAERQTFVSRLGDVQDYDDELLEELAMLFALYEKEVHDEIVFLKESLGEVTVAIDIEAARAMAADAIREAEFRWHG